MTDRPRAHPRRIAQVFATVTAIGSGCVTTTVPPVVARVARAAVAPPAPPPWVFTVVPSRPSVYAAGTEDDGAVDVIAGGLRIRIAGSSVEWARDLTLMPITAHARDRDQWLFATYDGALFRSDGFAGPLTHMGDAAGPWLTAGFDSTGTLAARGTDGGLWLADVASPLHRAPAPADGPLVDSGFIDPAFGVAVIAPGEVLRTLDGGLHFDPVDLGGRAAYVVYPNPDAFVLQTTAGLMRVERDGPAQPFAGPTGEWSHTIPEEVIQAIQGQPVPWSRDWLLLEGGVLGEDHSVLTVERNRATWLEPGSDRAHAPSVDLPGFECTAQGWGARAVAMCLEDPMHAVVVALDADHTTREMQRVAPHADMVASLEGTSLAVDSPCGAGVLAQARDDTPVCVFDGGTWLSRSLPTDDVHLLGIHGDRLLYERVRPEGGVEIHVRDIHDDANDHIVRTAGTTAIHGARFTASGVIVGIAETVGRPMLALGRGDAPLEVRPLPDGTVQIGFVDDDRGLAVGTNLGHVWTTRDGGRTWAGAHLGIEGDPSRAELSVQSVSVTRAAGLIQCGAHACTVGERLLWSEPGALDEVPTRAFAAASAPTASEDDRDAMQTPRDEGFQPGTARCEAVTPNASIEPRLPAYQQRLYGGDGWAEPRRTAPESPQGGGFAFVWGGVDARGTFESHARPATLPALVTPPALAALAAVNPADEGTMYLRYATRDLAVFERCVGYIDSAPCDLVIAPRGGVPHVLASQGTLLDFASAPVRLRSVLGLPDGGVVLHIAPAALSVETERRLLARVDMVVVLDRRGAVVQQRGYAWEQAIVYRMLARTPDAIGLAVARGRHPRELTFLGMSPQATPRPLATLPTGPLEPCRAAVAPDRTVVVADQVGYATAMMTPTGQYVFSAPANVRSTLEVSAGGEVCLRGVSFWSLHPADETPALEPLGGVPRLEAQAGALVGVAVDRRRSAALRCEFQ